MKEILVLANQHRPSLGCKSPDLTIGPLAQSYVQDVQALQPLRLKKARQRCWELVVNQEYHDTCKIAWSAWWAAYSIAASTSSRSRKG